MNSAIQGLGKMKEKQEYIAQRLKYDRIKKQFAGVLVTP